MKINSIFTTNGNTIFCAVHTSGDEIYFTCYYGLGVYNTKKGSIKIYSENVSVYDYFPISIIYDCYNDSVIYFSTPTMLTIFSCKHKISKNIAFNETGYGLKLLHGKIVFIGNQTNTLYINYKKTKVIVNNSNVYDVAYNHVWYISPTGGLMRYNIKSKHTTHLFKDKLFGTSSLKCSKDYVVVSDSILSKIYTISIKSLKITKSILLSPQCTNIFMYTNRENNKIWISTSHTGDIIKVYQFTHSGFKHKGTILSSNYTIGLIIGSKFYAYIYHSLYGSNSNGNIYVFKSGHGKYKTLNVFNHSRYQFTDGSGNICTYQALDQFIDDHGKMKFITTYKVYNGQPINMNAINSLEY